jgi:hypothetical protein
METMQCSKCSLPVPIDKAYSEGIIKIFCYSCLMSLRALRHTVVKALEPGKCSVNMCYGKSYFLIIKIEQFHDFEIEIPLQFCPVHHHQIVAKRLSEAGKLEEVTIIGDFLRQVDYEES